MDVKIAPDWKELLAPEFEKPYFVALTDFVRQEYATRRIYPRGSNIFRMFWGVFYAKLPGCAAPHCDFYYCRAAHVLRSARLRL